MLLDEGRAVLLGTEEADGVTEIGLLNEENDETAVELAEEVDGTADARVDLELEGAGTMLLEATELFDDEDATVDEAEVVLGSLLLVEDAEVTTGTGAALLVVKGAVVAAFVVAGVMVCVV